MSLLTPGIRPMLFGTSTPAPSLFGPTPSTSLFPTTSNPPRPAGGLFNTGFGVTPSPVPSGGLFGAPVTSQPASLGAPAWGQGTAGFPGQNGAPPIAAPQPLTSAFPAATSLFSTGTSTTAWSSSPTPGAGGFIQSGQTLGLTPTPGIASGVGTGGSSFLGVGTSNFGTTPSTSLFSSLQPSGGNVGAQGYLGIGASTQSKGTIGVVFEKVTFEGSLFSHYLAMPSLASTDKSVEEFRAEDYASRKAGQAQFPKPKAGGFLGQTAAVQPQSTFFAGNPAVSQGIGLTGFGALSHPAPSYPATSYPGTAPAASPFGNTGGLFGANPNPNANTNPTFNLNTGGSVYGGNQTAPSQPASGFFGANPLANPLSTSTGSSTLLGGLNTGKGIFGTTPQQQPSAGGLFGLSTTSPTWFGQATTQQPSALPNPTGGQGMASPSFGGQTPPGYFPNIAQSNAASGVLTQSVPMPGQLIPLNPLQSSPKDPIQLRYTQPDYADPHGVKSLLEGNGTALRTDSSYVRNGSNWATPYDEEALLRSSTDTYSQTWRYAPKVNVKNREARMQTTGTGSFAPYSYNVLDHGSMYAPHNNLQRVRENFKSLSINRPHDPPQTRPRATLNYAPPGRQPNVITLKIVAMKDGKEELTVLVPIHKTYTINDVKTLAAQKFFAEHKLELKGELNLLVSDHLLHDDQTISEARLHDKDILRLTTSERPRTVPTRTQLLPRARQPELEPEPEPELEPEPESPEFPSAVQRPAHISDAEPSQQEKTRQSNRDEADDADAQKDEASSDRVKVQERIAEQKVVLKEQLAPFEILPILTNPQYTTKPALQEIARMTEEELAHVKDFTIMNAHGKIVFSDVTDIRRLNLDAIVNIRPNSVVVYPDEKDNPGLGKGLNKPATITLYNCSQSVRSALRPQNFEKKLRKAAKKQGATHVSYSTEDNTWVFRVKHF